MGLPNIFQQILQALGIGSNQQTLGFAAAWVEVIMSVLTLSVESYQLVPNEERREPSQMNLFACMSSKKWLFLVVKLDYPASI